MKHNINWNIDEHGMLTVYLGIRTSLFSISQCDNMSNESIVNLINEEISERGYTRCNNCMKIFLDDGALEKIDDNGEIINACDICKTDEYLMQPFMIHRNGDSDE